MSMGVDSITSSMGVDFSSWGSVVPGGVFSLAGCLFDRLVAIVFFGMKRVSGNDMKGVLRSMSACEGKISRVCV
jgi:hypothetical protein